MNIDEFYVNMGKLIKTRDHARKMLQRWQDQLEEIEQTIENLVTNKEAAETEGETL